MKTTIVEGVAVRYGAVFTTEAFLPVGEPSASRGSMNATVKVRGRLVSESSEAVVNLEIIIPLTVKGSSCTYYHVVAMKTALEYLFPNDDLANLALETHVMDADEIKHVHIVKYKLRITQD